MLRSMTTTNPRLTVTLTPAVAAVLRELSKVGGQSQSAIVGELLQVSVPIFERVVLALRAAETVQAGAKAEIAAGLERAQAKLESQMALVLNQFDDAHKPLLEEAEKVSRRGTGDAGAGMRAARPATAAAVRKALATPVPLTGGSGHPKRGKTGRGKGGGHGVL